jgi:nucleotide-binding universal stress UspA family protein
MIPTIKDILYATDLSKNSAFAFRYAVHLAERHDARIRILHVIETFPPATEGLLSFILSDERIRKIRTESTESLTKRIKERLNQFAERELKDAPERLKRVTSISVVFGDPANEILQKVDELQCDLVIMGTHGKGIIGHTFLGSVSEKVLHRTSKPVFVIPLPRGETDITLGEI